MLAIGGQESEYLPQSVTLPDVVLVMAERRLGGSPRKAESRLGGSPPEKEEEYAGIC